MIIIIMDNDNVANGEENNQWKMTNIVTNVIMDNGNIINEKKSSIIMKWYYYYYWQWKWRMKRNNNKQWQ
jgi:hypothetical protein